VPESSKKKVVLEFFLLSTFAAMQCDDKGDTRR